MLIKWVSPPATSYSSCWALLTWPQSPHSHRKGNRARHRAWLQGEHHTYSSCANQYTRLSRMRTFQPLQTAVIPLLHHPLSTEQKRTEQSRLTITGCPHKGTRRRKGRHPPCPTTSHLRWKANVRSNLPTHQPGCTSFISGSHTNRLNSTGPTIKQPPNTHSPVVQPSILFSLCVVVFRYRYRYTRWITPH